MYLKKPLLLFLTVLILFLLALFAYQKYCKSKPGGCKKIEKEEYPRKGIDW